MPFRSLAHQIDALRTERDRLATELERTSRRWCWSQFLTGATFPAILTVTAMVLVATVYALVAFLAPLADLG